jgi:hypothetical protein
MYKPAEWLSPEGCAERRCSERQSGRKRRESLAKAWWDE